jgi:hypothetical protein
VFRDPVRLMENVERVTDHLRSGLERERVPHSASRTPRAYPVARQ